jgi:dolichol-phosphate mannosyltransferase
VRRDIIDIERAPSVADQPLELAVIIPTFNESANVERLLDRLAIALAGISWEAIFVDDNSPDGTADAVRQIARANRTVRIVHRIGRRGLSSAVVEGMLASAAPVLAVIDGDMQHDEAILPRLFAEVASGEADIAIGTRYAKGGGTGDWATGRVRASRWATRIGQVALKTDISDPLSGFFAVSRETLMQAVPRLSGVGFKILLDVVASLPARPRIAEIPYTFRSREAGESKADLMAGAEYLALIADKTVGRFVPIRLISFLGIGGLGVGVHMGVLGAALFSGLGFLAAEIAAVVTAMTFNFFLNNLLTYRDRRLKGWRMARGLLSFYAVCSVGAVANIGIGTWLNDLDNIWWVAGLAGVVVGAIWNFAATSFVTWRKA